MKIFLTGASGYIGRHVALELLSRGHEVIGLARKKSERTAYSDEMEWCYSDLSHYDAYWSSLVNAEAVVHCAMGYTSEGTENFDLDQSFVHRMGDYQGHFVYTGNLFGERRSEGLEEAIKTESEHWRFQTEKSVMNQFNNAAVIRLGFVYGSSGGYFWDILSPGTLSQLDDASVPDAVWPMVHVRDVATLYANVLETKGRGVFHAFDGTNTSALEVIRSTREVYRSHGIAHETSHDYIHGLLQSSIVTSNMRSLDTGWKPACTTFRDCIENSYAEHENRSA